MTERRVGAHKVTFDASRCDGFGMCSLTFPERISLDPWGFADVETEPFSDTASLRRAARAVRCCPRQALSLVPVEDTLQSARAEGTDARAAGRAKLV